MNKLQQLAGTLLVMAASILALIVGPLALLIWWIESRFGSTNAGAVLLSLAILIGVLAGWFMAHRSQKAALVNAADFLHEAASAQKAQAGVAREYARIEREAFMNRAKLEVLDAKRIEQLAQQRAKLLAAPEHQEKPPDIWTIPDQQQATNNGFQYLE